MAGPLLPLAFDFSRQGENHAPLNLEQQRSESHKRRRRGNYSDDEDYEEEVENECDQAEPLNDYRFLGQRSDSLEDSILNDEADHFGNSRSDTNVRVRVYSHLNSSSSIINQQPYTDTSSTVILHTNNQDNFDETRSLQEDSHFGIPRMDNILSSNIDVPSSPILNSEPDILNTYNNDPLRSDAFDDLVSFNNNITLRQVPPSSPTHLSSSQHDSIEPLHKPTFERPKLERPTLHKKLTHSLSRTGSTFKEPDKKKHRTTNLIKVPSLTRQGSSNISVLNEYEIDKNGRVIGYKLEPNKLPIPVEQTIDKFDDPKYHVLKNEPEAVELLKKKIDGLFESPGDLNKSNFILLNLQRFNLYSLPDSICECDELTIFNDNFECIKPLLHIDVSYNNLKTINPNIFKMDRLEMLSLRNNNIERLNGSVEFAVKLKSLNLGINKLKFLPHNILNLSNLKVLAVNGNPMIPTNEFDIIHRADIEKLKSLNDVYFYCENEQRQLKQFSSIHWYDSNNINLSKNRIYIAKLINDTHSLLKTNGKRELLNEKQHHIQSSLPLLHKLSQIALQKIADYLPDKFELSSWKMLTNEVIFNRIINSLICDSNFETCGSCLQVCAEPVANIFEWWDLKGSKSVTVKRRFCSKKCTVEWEARLNQLREEEPEQDGNLL